MDAGIVAAMIRRSNGRTFALGEIASKLNAPLTGDPSLSISGVSPLNAIRPQTIAFVADRKPSKLRFIASAPEQAAFFVPEDFPKDALQSKGAVFVKDPQRAAIATIDLFYDRERPGFGLSEKADIHPSAKIAAGCEIGPFCTVMRDVQIGENVIIYPNSVIYPGVVIGPNCVLHAGVVIREDVTIAANCTIQPGAIIGGDGFGYIPDPQVGLIPVPQVGSVRLAPHVDIGANACVDRGAIGDTELDMGVKIDNLAQIGHNVKIGRFSIVCGSAAIGGSTEIGSQVVIGGGTGIADHLTICDKARFGGLSGVTGSIEKPGDYLGFPAIDASQWRRQQGLLRRLPEFAKQLKMNR